MRTRANIHLDQDAYDFASTYAQAKGMALGAAISELLRRAEQTPELPSSRLKRDEHGYLVVAAREGEDAITPEIVKAALEDDFD